MAVIILKRKQYGFAVQKCVQEFTRGMTDSVGLVKTAFGAIQFGSAMANIVDPDQTAPVEKSDLGLHYLLGPVWANIVGSV